MKRILLVLALVLAAVAAYASSALTVSPSTMKDGETKTLTDDDGTVVKVTRHGKSVDVKIDGAEGSKQLTITNGDDGEMRIDRDGHRKTVIVGPEGRIVIDGRELKMPRIPRVRVPRMHHRDVTTFFVCPKDGATLQIPDSKKDDKTYKCPVDGTTMEKKKGHGFSFYFDDHDFDFDFDEL
jgi:hypothetical protein